MSDIIPITARTFSFKHAGCRQTLQFDDEYLTSTSECGAVTHTDKTRLWRIMPQVLVDRSLSHSAKRNRLVFQLSFLALIVVYFSEIPRYVPLLVPALALYAVYSFYHMVRGIYPFEKSKIVTDWGDLVAVLPHHENLATERKAFEEALIEAVEEARQSYYDD